jgi:hypothetical protein
MSSHLDDARRGRAGLQAAIGQVEQALAANGPTDTWSAGVGAGLNEIEQALSAHVQRTEAPDGLLQEILHQAPQLASRVQRARDEHVALRTLLGEAHAAADDGAVVDLRERTGALLAAFERHRHLGTEMVYDAFNVDLEAAD